jgi:uracil-DNA glycosylase
MFTVAENTINNLIEPSWRKLLGDEFESSYFYSLLDFLAQDGKIHQIYPSCQLIFNAFNQTPINAVKVIILGQDPYHGPGQAHGLSFSVPDGIKPPPSLKNIFKEIEKDLKLPLPKSGNLESWAKQGVLLLNAILTVRANSPASHHNRGWEEFTDAVITKLSENKDHLVFMLWGNYAKGKKKLIDANKHLILEAAHPSPFSVTKFFNCRHFSKTNEFLNQKGMDQINWRID